MYDSQQISNKILKYIYIVGKYNLLLIRMQMNINNYLIKQQPRATAFLNKILEIVHASDQWINSFCSTDRKIKIIGFVIFLFAQYNVFGQAEATSNYEIKKGSLGTTYSWINCSGGNAMTTGDDAEASFNWPFNFNFYDNSYTTSNVLSVATNGFIRLDDMASTDGNAASSYDLTNTATNLGQIIALGVFDGKVGDNGGWVRSLVTGTAPNRIYTIEYNNYEIDFDDGLYADVQVSFYESSNKIVLKFGADDVTQSGADMGIHSGVSGYLINGKKLTVVPIIRG